MKSHGHGVCLPKVTGLGHLTSSRGRLALGQEQPVSGCARHRRCAGGSVAAGCPAAPGTRRVPASFPSCLQYPGPGKAHRESTVITYCGLQLRWILVSAVWRQNPPPAKWYLPHQHRCLHGINHCSN